MMLCSDGQKLTIEQLTFNQTTFSSLRQTLDWLQKVQLKYELNWFILAKVQKFQLVYNWKLQLELL